MQRTYITKYVLIALSAISLSLSGMRESETPNHIYTLEPRGGFFSVTAENKDDFEKRAFASIPLTVGTNVIMAQVISHKNTIDERINQDIGKSGFVPLAIFTQSEPLITKNQLLSLQFSNNLTNPQESFKSHIELINSPIQNNNNFIDKIINTKIQDAKIIQKFFNTVTAFKFLAQPTNQAINNNIPSAVTKNEKPKTIIPISNRIAQRSRTLLNMFKDFGDTKNDNPEEMYFYELPQHIDKETMDIVLELINLRLMINPPKEKETPIDDETINQQIVPEFLKTINNLPLENLIKVMIAVEILDIVEPNVTEKETCAYRNISLETSLFSSFLRQLIALPAEKRNAAITALNNQDIENKLLRAFVDSEKLADKVNGVYNKLMEYSFAKNLYGDDSFKNAVSYDAKTMKFHNKELTLEKAFLINKFFTTKPSTSTKFIITDDAVTTRVSMVLNAWNEIEQQQQRDEEERLRDLNAMLAQQQKNIDAEIARVTEYNSMRAKIGRFLTANKTLLLKATGVAAYCTYMLYLLYTNETIRNYFSQTSS